jgi:hypothetical protein
MADDPKPTETPKQVKPLKEQPNQVSKNPPEPIETKPALPGAMGDENFAEKVKVKTSGDFNLMDPFSGRHIDANSDGDEIPLTTWVQNQLDNGRLIKA